MTIARVHLVDPLVSRWYHCITRCVRRARLLGENSDRKDWIEHRLKELAEIFGISVAGFAVLDNHLHLLVRLDPETVKNWSDDEVIRRWARLFPPRDKMRRPLEVSDEWVKGHLLNAAWIKRARQRLGSLSWFMKCLKEPLARLANRQDQATGAFFEGRFKSIAVLDEGSLLATCAYIDLNPVAAGIAATPEASVHTSIKERVDHVAAQERTEDLTAARTSSAAASKQAAGLEEKLWLCPVEDRRRIDSTREGMIEGFALGSYVLLVDYTARLFREGKAILSREMAEILDRLHTSAEQWHARLDRLRTGRPLGRFFAATRARLREIGTRLNLKHVPNLGGCPVT